MKLRQQFVRCNMYVELRTFRVSGLEASVCTREVSGEGDRQLIRYDSRYMDESVRVQLEEV